jgi:hypothetical protein
MDIMIMIVLMREFLSKPTRGDIHLKGIRLRAQEGQVES